MAEEIVANLRILALNGISDFTVGTYDDAQRASGPGEQLRTIYNVRWDVIDTTDLKTQKMRNFAVMSAIRAALESEYEDSHDRLIMGYLSITGGIIELVARELAPSMLVPVPLSVPAPAPAPIEKKSEAPPEIEDRQDLAEPNSWIQFAIVMGSEIRTFIVQNRIALTQSDLPGTTNERIWKLLQIRAKETFYPSWLCTDHRPPEDDYHAIRSWLASIMLGLPE